MFCRTQISEVISFPQDQPVPHGVGIVVIAIVVRTIGICSGWEEWIGKRILLWVHFETGYHQDETYRKVGIPFPHKYIFYFLIVKYTYFIYEY